MPFIPFSAGTALTRPYFSERVAAGFPSPAQGYEQKPIDLNELLVTNATATYFVQAQGDSMTDAGIADKDTLVVDFSLTPKNGDIVIARINDGFTVKRLKLTPDAMSLHPENKAANYPVIIPRDGQSVEIMGVVKWVLHPC